jgi:hypothetical protein
MFSASKIPRNASQDIKPRKRSILRYSQIGFVGACILAWMTSHAWYVTAWCGTQHTAVVLESLRGNCQFRIESNKIAYIPPYFGLRIERVFGYEDNSDSRDWNWAGFGASWQQADALYPTLKHSLIGCPYWFLTVTIAAAANFPWRNVPRRFGLRTLLIAVTLVAFVLGIAIITI